MKLEKITVQYGYTKNIGNFESARTDYSETFILQDGDDPLESRKAAIDKALDGFRQAFVALPKNTKEK